MSAIGDFATNKQRSTKSIALVNRAFDSCGLLMGDCGPIENGCLVHSLESQTSPSTYRELAAKESVVTVLWLQLNTFIRPYHPTELCCLFLTSSESLPCVNKPPVPQGRCRRRDSDIYTVSSRKCCLIGMAVPFAPRPFQKPMCDSWNATLQGCWNQPIGGLLYHSIQY